MPRAIWSGSIAFGLVNAPVRMYAAIDEHDLELHLVHEKDGSRIGFQKICKDEGKPVPDDEIVKGYEVDGELVLLEPEDFEAAESDGYKTIEILDFVPHGEIDPVYFERSFYLGPQDGSEKVYALLVEALDQSGLTGIARYVFHDRERLGALRVRDSALVLARMYFADEIRPLEEVRPKRRGKVDKRELTMALDLVERFTGTFDPAAYEDRYRERLLEIVEQKRRGGEVQPVTPAEREKTPDLLAALQESLAQYTRDGRARASGSSQEGGLDGLTMDELGARARELGISGRSKMTKRQLVAAIEKEDG
jgi:DNA end-binding protein Ku